MYILLALIGLACAIVFGLKPTAKAFLWLVVGGFLLACILDYAGV